LPRQQNGQASFVLDALEQALHNRRPAYHSDIGEIYLHLCTGKDMVVASERLLTEIGASTLRPEP